jgi:hypothetical protein
MGRGHSGSTVLDFMLGNHQKIQSTGELTSGFGFRSGLEHCSCQASLDECELWGNIRKELRQLHPETGLDDFGEMMDYMVRFYRIPQIKTQQGLPVWVKTKYEPMTYDLYNLIAMHSGRTYIVDSSKDMAHAYYLLTRFPGKTKIIHLVRDGRGVMWSRLRRLRAGQPFQFLRRYYAPKSHWAFMILTVLSWDFANGVGLLFGLLHQDRVIQVRYEDLCCSPAQELIRIGEFLGLDMAELTAKLEKAEPFRIGHSVGGNAMRHSSSGEFVFKPDHSWRMHLPVRYQRLFVLLAFPIALYYGYLRGNRL